MSARKLLVSAAILFATMLNACSAPAPAHVITHEAKFNLDPSQYPALVSRLDAEMAQIGLTRYGAAPGLNELKGRQVLFADYRFNLSDKWAVLTVEDVNKAGAVTAYVYLTVLKEEKTRGDAISRINSVLAAFGSTLVERPKQMKL
jgi:hypothetical protein